MTPRVFALSDTHLSFPMVSYDRAWAGHMEKIERRWREAVSTEDIVLIGGDVSSARKLQDALPDLRWLESLPGRKVFVKGNHDLWWRRTPKVRAATGDGMHFLDGDAVVLGDVAIAGTRFWTFPAFFPDFASPAQERADGVVGISPTRAAVERPQGSAPNSDSVMPGWISAPWEEQLRQREIERLKNSLAQLPESKALRLALVHFPPIGCDCGSNPITDLLEEFGIDVCVYGHLHPLPGRSLPCGDCVIGSTRFLLCSSVWLDFRPKCIWAPGGAG